MKIAEVKPLILVRASRASTNPSGVVPVPHVILISPDSASDWLRAVGGRPSCASSWFDNFGYYTGRATVAQRPLGVDPLMRAPGHE